MKVEVRIEKLESGERKKTPGKKKKISTGLIRTGMSWFPYSAFR